MCSPIPFVEGEQFCPSSMPKSARIPKASPSLLTLTVLALAGVAGHTWCTPAVREGAG